MKAFLAAAFALAAIVRPAAAQTYPAKPVTVVVPFSAGGTTDVLARIAAEHMSRTLGQPMVIENVTGAGGTIGVTRVAKAQPDGHTLLVGNLGTNAAAYTIYRDTIQYDPRELASVGMIAATPMFLAVKKDFPAKTFQEFVAYAKQNPGKVTNGHGGVGSTSHLVCLFLGSLAGIDMVSVPYRGSGPAMTDLVAGQIDSVCDQSVTVVPQLASGAIRPLVIAEVERIAATPGVPTSKEAGMPAFQATGWNAMFAPKGTPQAVVDRLNDAIAKALADPAVQKRIDDLGAIRPKPDEARPSWLADLVRTEVDKWGKVIRESNVKPQ